MIEFVVDLYDGRKPTVPFGGSRNQAGVLILLLSENYQLVIRLLLWLKQSIDDACRSFLGHVFHNNRKSLMFEMMQLRKFERKSRLEMIQL